MDRSVTGMRKMYCAHGYPQRLCNLCAVPVACVHGMVRDCLLCNPQGLDSWFGKASPEISGASFAGILSLKLGLNEKYRPAILLAAKRSGMEPASIAAVINAEAGPMAKGQKKEKLVDEVFRNAYPERDWDKRPLNSKTPSDAPLIAAWKKLYASAAWDERSLNSKSRAAGLTQFIDDTWIDEAQRAGTYLFNHAQAHGYHDSKCTIIPSKMGEFLDLRYDPTLSIVAAAEYDKHVFEQLSKRMNRDVTEVDKIFFAKYPGRDFVKQPLNKNKESALIKEWNQILQTQPGTPLVPKNLSSDQKARYLYLCHHEGLEGATQILNGSLTDSHAKYLFSFNLDDAEVDPLVDEHGSLSKAYIGWIWKYIDQHVQPGGFRA